MNERTNKRTNEQTNEWMEKNSDTNSKDWKCFHKAIEFSLT